MITLHKKMGWPSWVFAINLFLILVTAILPYMRSSSLKWSVFNRLNLANEMNLAVWWSASLILLVAIIAYELSKWDVDSRSAWVILAILFCLLSLDEIGSIHERVGNLALGQPAYILTAVLAGSALSVASWILWKKKSDRSGLVLLLTGIALLVSAVPNEYLEHHVSWPNYLQGPRSAFEEGLEISGALVCLIGIARYRTVDQLRRMRPESLSAIGLPTSTKKILWAGFVLHIEIAWISTHSIEIAHRGNPAIWYFMAIFYFLAFTYFLKAREKQPSTNFTHLLTSGNFLALSAGSVYSIYQTSTSIFDQLGPLANPNILLGFQLLIALVVYFLLMRGFSWKGLFPFFTVALALGASLYLNNQFVTYVASGYFALITASLFLQSAKAEINNL